MSSSYMWVDCIQEQKTNKQKTIFFLLNEKCTYHVSDDYSLTFTQAGMGLDCSVIQWQNVGFFFDNDIEQW